MSVLAGHDLHELEQVGRCVYCKTCDQRLYQGTLPASRWGPKRWQVRLLDGFVAYRGAKGEAEAVAGRHPGAVVEPSDD